jgi:hypothetical protein
MKTSNRVVLPFTLILISIFFVSCDSNEKKKTTLEETQKVELDINEPDLEEIAILRKCYTGVLRVMNVSMSLEIENELVTGELTYTENEEVVKSGIVTGEFSADTLFVSYKYVNEENENIVEELVFMRDLKKSVVVQGSAKTEKNKNLIKILDFNNINFDGPVFEKYDCDQL